MVILIYTDSTTGSLDLDIVSNEDQVDGMAESSEMGMFCYAEVTSPPQMLTHYQLLITHYKHSSDAE